MKTTGRVNGIISNIVIVKADGPVGQNEICYVWTGDTKMMAEVIKVIGDAAYVQVFDSTRGLKIGDRVEFEGHMLEVTLAPGLLSRNYDGLLLLLHYKNSYEDDIEPNAEQIIKNQKDGHQTFISAKGSLPVISVGSLMKFKKMTENKKAQNKHSILFCTFLFLNDILDG